MNMMTEDRVLAGLRGKLSLNEPMSRHTSWRTGGVAEKFYQPADLDDLHRFLSILPADEPLVVVGLGSNLLVRDGGIRGTVLLMHGALRELRLEQDGLVYAQAGVPGAKLARFAALHDMSDAEFFAGIPGTLGGMLAMNAGCYGGETWRNIERVQVMTHSGEIRICKPEEYEIGYRSVSRLESKTAGERSEERRAEESGASSERTFPTGKDEEAGHSSAIRSSPRSLPNQELFVGAWFRFASGDGEIARRKIKDLLSRRIASQPLNLPNAGSVFRNPPNDHAARLIEQCGLKGEKIGGASVSKKHANFIVNEDGATAKDIEDLISMVRKTVEKQTGVLLHAEVKIIGEYEKND